MRKIKIIFPLLALLMLSGCSGGRDEMANPVLDPVGHTADMLDLKQEMQENVQGSMDKENARLNNTLNDNNMSDVAKTLGDNSALVKKYTGAVLKTSLGDMQFKFNNAATERKSFRIGAPNIKKRFSQRVAGSRDSRHLVIG